MTCDRYAPHPQPTQRAGRSAQRRQSSASRRRETSDSDPASARLAAAEARIAALEAALHEARLAASHDPLTGVLNRRGLSEAFARETSRAQRNDQALTLALIDLDAFKQINDCHGHAAGDEALRHLTRLIAATLRPTDLCARLGGDEFVLLMPDTDLAAARAAIARLQQAAQQQPLASSRIVLRFSTGLASAAGKTLDAALMHADTAVYRAKSARQAKAA